MNQVQLAVNEIKSFCKRRKKILILCPLLITAVSAAVAWKLPDKYNSSIAILVQQEETLNPMIRFNLAVALASEDRLKSFNEIIYSRSTMNMLIDSMNLDQEYAEELQEDREEVIKKVRKNIQTSLKASDSFTITYSDTKAKRAKEAVELLSDHFIKTKLQLETKRNAQTVEFFQEKLQELRETVERREEELIGKIGQDVKSTPRENTGLQRNLEDVENQLNELNLNIRTLQNRLEVVAAVSSGERNIEALHQLNASELPSGEELSTLLSDYEGYAKRYTSEYPTLKELKEKVYDTAGQIKSELESTLLEKKAQISFLENEERILTQKIEKTTIAEQKSTQTKMDFDVYRTLYDEMKVKLEQAKTTRDLGKNAKNQFVVVDPPVVSQKPDKPNRPLLAGGGLFLGLFLGVVVAAIAEFLDTTVRRPSDIKHFNKPVVAFIPEAN